MTRLANETIDPSALKAFASNLPTQAQVLDAAAGSGATLLWLKSAGYQVEGVEADSGRVALAKSWGLEVTQKDLRLISLKKEHYDGIWCAERFSEFSIEECQRVLLSFFQALKPRTGVLFVSFLKKEESIEKDGLKRFAHDAFFSLLKQSGFQPWLEAERKDGEKTWIAVLSRRI